MSFLSKSTNKFYSTLFNRDTFLGKLNRTLDPLGREVADDAIEKTTPVPDAVLPPPVAMPGMDDEAVRRARRRKIAGIQSQGGRASTIYTDGDGSAKLGG